MKFSKYHGLGNDFVIVDLRSDPDGPGARRIQDPSVVRLVCDRRFGVGGDGVLAILPGRSDAAAARMRVLNADGTEAEMCGNGLRCVVKHLYDRDPAMRRDSLTIDTGAGPLRCDISGDTSDDTPDDRQVCRTVTVDMGKPRLARSDIPMIGPAHERCIATPLHIRDREFAITAVSMGNPHVVTFVEETCAALRTLAESFGPALEVHEWFPARANIEFAHIHGPRDVELVVWERGCGITSACGTGACATIAAGCVTGRLSTDTEINVRLLGGDLAITMAGDLQTAYMRGPATLVFDAELDLDALTA